MRRYIFFLEIYLEYLDDNGQEKRGFYTELQIEVTSVVRGDPLDLRFWGKFMRDQRRNKKGESIQK